MPQPPASSFADDLAKLRAGSAPADTGSGQPVDDFAADLDSLRSDTAATATRADGRSRFARLIDAVFSPVPAVQSRVESLADVIDTPREHDFLQTPLGMVTGKPAAMAKGFTAGALEGIGSLLTPGDVLLTLAGLRSVKDAGRVMGTTARGVEALGSGAMVARGAERVLDADSLSDAAAGTAQAALGGAGVAASRRPRVQASPRRQLASAPIAVTPEGVAMAPGTLPSPATGPSVRDVRAQISAERARTGGAPIDMQPADDGTFVAAERSSGQRAATLGRTADGRTVYSGDHNAVDAPVTPIAALPERAETLDEFVPTPGGRVARKRDVTDLRPLVDEAGQPIDDFGADLAQLRATPVHPGKPAREPMTRPAAVADREFDGAAVTRTIYSSDPAAVDAPLIALEDPDRHELRRMLAEMDSLPFTPRTFNEPGIGQGGAPAVVGGAGGARVYDDVTKGYASSRPSRAEVAQGIREALDETPTALAQRALAVARGRQRGDPAVSRPQLPDEAGDLAQSGRMTDTDAREFDRFVARLAGDGTDDLGFLGEAGAVSPALLQHLGGAAAGATAGVASTDEHDSTARQVLRGVVGGALGAAAPALLRSGRPGGSTAARLTDHAPAAPGARATGTDQPAVEPFATASREPATPKHGRTDPLKGVDTFIEKFPEELRVGVREVIERHGGFDAQRRGVIRAEDTARLAEHIRVEASRRLKPGTALNAEGIRRFTDGIASAQAKVNQFAGKVARGDATDADVLALEAARAEVGTLAASVMGARSEAGRALAEFKVLARVLQTGNPKLVREAVEGLRGDAAAFAEAFGQQPPDPVARYRWLQQQRQGGLGEKVRSYYYANILSGLKTHERNVIGNAANVLSNVVVQPFQAGADAVRSAVTGAPRTVRLSELPSQVAGAVVGIPRGFAEALFSARYGVNRSALTQAMSAAEAGKLDVPRVEFAGGGANPFNWPGRALDSADQFFRTIAKSMELSGLAHAQATREGLTGQKLQNRMAALMAGGDPLSAQLEQQADAFARRGVFQEKPDRFASSLQVFSKQHPSFAFVVPFIKTPANILRQGLEFSPAGALMKEARKEGRAGSQAQGRAALGSLAAGYLAYLASTGRLSGSGPSDATERAQLMESGWRPNSVKVGDAWVSYSLFQPVSVQAAVIANAFEAWQDGEADGDSAKRGYQTVMKSARSFLDQSFLSGLADVVDAVENFDRDSAVKPLARVAHSLTPFAGAQRTVRDALDPVVRKPEGFVENIAANMPRLSAGVPARQDRFGRDVTREGGALRRAADPLNVSTETDDPVVTELARLGARVGFASDRLTGVELTRDQRQYLQRAKGQTSYRVLERLLASDGYQHLSDERKLEAIEKAVDVARQHAAKAMKGALNGQGRRGQLPITPLPPRPAGQLPIAGR